MHSCLGFGSPWDIPGSSKDGIWSIGMIPGKGALESLNIDEALEPPESKAHQDTEVTTKYP